MDTAKWRSSKISRAEPRNRIGPLGYPGGLCFSWRCWLFRRDAVGQPAPDLVRDLRAVALADAIERFPDDLFQSVEVDDVAQLAGVRVQPAPAPNEAASGRAMTVYRSGFSSGESNGVTGRLFRSTNNDRPYSTRPE
jgi:hypothetical protein